MHRFLKSSLGMTVLLALVFIYNGHPATTPFVGHGDPETLSKVYQRWKSGYEQQGAVEVLRLGLNYSRAESTDFTTAQGQLALNLLNGELQVDVQGLDEGGQYDVWLLDKQNQRRVGTLAFNDGRHSLRTRLESAEFSGFTLDSVAVSKANANPQNGGVLFGSPGLMQRIYYSERYWPLTEVVLADGGSKLRPPQTGGFAFLLPKVAWAAGSASGAEQLTNLVAKGNQIFSKETFDGNGRTCATCHRPENNHTIDPAFIAKLPAKDPLFVAEYNPALAGLEKPALLRQFALITANADGYENPPVQRSVPHLLGLGMSMTFETTAMGGEFHQDTDYFTSHNAVAAQDNRTTQAIGWSQDGAPDGGALRDFAKGAIKQHLPQTLGRVAGVDFRQPTPDELDALEAYMLSLGRSADINLAALTFSSPMVQKGMLLFNTKNNPGQTLSSGYPVGGAPVFGTTANCNGCHMNAGAISSTTGGNPTRDTGVERMRDQLHHLADPSVAYDGGFGDTLQTDCGPDFDQTCYSDGSQDPHNIRPAAHAGLNRFNTPSLIEAADTGPYFHNNSISTLEETVAYYNTQAFNNSPGAFTSKGVNRQVQLDSSQVLAVSLFLRSINVLENIRSSNRLDQNAMQKTDGAGVHANILLAIAETQDAIDDLQGAVFNPYPEALGKLQAALREEHLALTASNLGGANFNKSWLSNAIALKNQAHALMVSGG